MDLASEVYERINARQLWSKTIVLNRNDLLKTGGTTDTSVYFIISGSLKIFILDESEEHIVRFGYRHEFITALDSFISGMPSDFYIQALKKTTLKAISKEAWLAFMQETPDNKALWDAILQQLLLQQLDREIDILTASPRARYERVLKRSPRLFQEIPHKHIASYLRMSPETLSRLKKS